MFNADTISHLWDRIRASLWFVPSIMAVGAAVSAALMPALDRALSDEWLSTLPLVFPGQPVGARAVLSTIATSMIATAGVVFSMTIVSLQLASSQFGPRLLRTFLRDRGNQVVLGTFLGIFIYCILVLPTIDTTADAVFVPHISVTVAVLLSIVGLAMFVYFIDHVAQSIHADAVIKAVACELDDIIDRIFPEPVGEGVESDSDGWVSARSDTPGFELTAAGTGYLSFINGDSVMEMASGEDLFIRFDAGPGQYVFEGDALASVWSAEPMSEACVEKLREAFVLGTHRTPLQDAPFAFEQLTEMAERALSSGINDPATAMHCVDRIGSALARLVGRQLPASLRRDGDEVERILAEPVSLTQILRGTLDPIAGNAGGQLRVWLRLLGVLEKAFDRARRSADRQVLRGRALRFAEQAQAIFDQAGDREQIASAVAWAGQAG